MELIWKELDAERLIACETVQVHIEGELPSPDGRTPSMIPASNARVIIDSAVVEQGEIKISGRIAVRLTALDEASLPFGFESSAGFTHTVRMERALPGMRAIVTPTVQTLTAVPNAHGASLGSDIDLSVMVVSSVPMKVTGGIAGVNDLEMKTRRIQSTERKLLGNETLRMREELSADGISDVISAEGQINVRDVTLEQGAATVSGTITVSAVTSDSAGRLGQMIRQIPFRERIGINGISSSVFCQAELGALYLRALGEEFALVSMEAEVTLKVFGITEKELILPVDAFSPTIGFDCLFDEVKLLSATGIGTAQVSLKETLQLPDNAPEIGAPLFAAVRPIVTDTESEEGEISVSGVLVTTLCYESKAGRCFVFSEEVPFTASAENPDGCNMPIMAASCTAQITGTTERGLQVQYSLLIETERYRTETLLAAVGLAERELPERKSGILIFVTSAGDEVFDAAKRCGVSCESVRKLNPDVTEPFAEGEKLILLV